MMENEPEKLSQELEQQLQEFQQRKIDREKEIQALNAKGEVDKQDLESQTLQKIGALGAKWGKVLLFLLISRNSGNMLHQQRVITIPK
jgi:hypothetical protein